MQRLKAEAGVGRFSRSSELAEVGYAFTQVRNRCPELEDFVCVTQVGYPVDMSCKADDGKLQIFGIKLLVG